MKRLLTILLVGAAACGAVYAWRSGCCTSVCKRLGFNCGAEDEYAGYTACGGRDL